MINDLIAAFLLGLISAGHCMGMCGGLMVAAGIHSKTALVAMSYNVGRLLSYMTLGLVFGSITLLLPDQFLPLLKLLSASLLLLAALYLLNANQWITSVEKLGLPIWKLVKPSAQKLLPVKNGATAIGLGYLWGFIPCGLVYTALAFSLGQKSPLSTTMLMLAFGLGTFPAMMGMSLLANHLRKWLSLPSVKALLAATMVIFSLTIIWSVFVPS
jgi:sulfite exporter TauE/SafE